MRVALDAGPLLNPRTGIGHYTASLLEHMLKLDGDVEFSLFALTRARRSYAPPARTSLRHWRFPARVVVTSWELLGIPRGELLTGPCDLVHGTNYWIPPVKRTPGVVNIYDLTFWLYPEMCTPQVQRYRWIVPRVLKRCSAVMVPTEIVAGQLAAELRFPRDRIFVIPGAVRGEFTHAHGDSGLRRRLGVDGTYVLFAGTQEPRKNLDRLIQAFARTQIPDLRLVIAGPPGWGSIDLPAVAKKLNVADRVVFSGYLADVELAELMAEARAFMFPSLYEGFGLPALEAMAGRIPVVAGNAGSLPEVLDDAPFWCDPLDVDSIATAIESAVTDEAARRRAIERGLAQASRYSWDEAASLTLQSYRRIVS